MLSPAILSLVGLAALALLFTAVFLIYLVIRYEPIISNIFDETPMFLPLRLPPDPSGEEVRFRTRDGLELVGTYWKAKTAARLGVVVFCHEFLSDRWSAQGYVDYLRDLGFDLFAFDFRNHGESDKEAGYQPRQWLTDREIRDLRAAIAYLRSRPDSDPAGFALFGVSRGGSAALSVASRDPGVWGVVTDGAFPTHGTMIAYIQRWGEIYAGDRPYYRYMPTWIFHFLAGASRFLTQRRRSYRFPNVEQAAAKVSPRPWLMIHGEKDAYIGPEIARALFDRAREPKEIWIVPGAKHNRCREVEPEAYPARVGGFLLRHGPRQPAPAKVEPPPASVAATVPG